jgi:Amt family ammonium transporter
VLGCICTGLFASTAWNASGANGLFQGGTKFFFMETLSVLLTAVYAFCFTYAALWLINKVVKVKVDEDEESEGLDEALHGENAYEMI